MIWYYIIEIMGGGPLGGPRVFSYIRICVVVVVVVFSHNFMLRVSFASDPGCVDADCWNRFVSTPAGPGTRLLLLLLFSFIFTYSFLIKAGFLEADFHHTTIFWIFATYNFSHHFRAPPYPPTPLESKVWSLLSNRVLRLLCYVWAYIYISSYMYIHVYLCIYICIYM